MIKEKQVRNFKEKMASKKKDINKKVWGRFEDDDSQMLFEWELDATGHFENLFGHLFVYL